MPNTMMTQAVAMDLDGTGVLVDVTQFVRWADGVQKTGTKQDQFRDSQASVKTFIFENYSGRWTPGVTGTAFAATTLAAGASIGATSISSTALIPAGAWVVIGSGSTKESAVTGTPTGAGPFTIPLLSGIGNYALQNVQAISAPVVPHLTLAENMATSWSVTGPTGSPVLRGGNILTMTPSDDNWALLTITCDDMLGAASRNTPTAALAVAALAGSNPYLLWTMGDAAGASFAAETSGNNGPSLYPLTSASPLGTITFGNPGVVYAGGGTQATLTIAAAAQAQLIAGSNVFPAVQYPTASAGFWGLLTTPPSSTTPWNLQVTNALGTWQITTSGGIQLYPPSGSSILVSPANTPTGPVDLAMSITGVLSGTWTITTTLYINGTASGTSSFTSATFTNANKQTTNVVFGANGSGPDAISVQNIWHGPTIVNQSYASVTTEANRITLIDQTTPIITLAALPAGLSPALVGAASTSGQSVLDMLNAEMRTEQGYIDCVTTGTLTSPVQKIRIRERTRSATVAYTFDTQLEVMADSAAPIQFVRDTTNLIWSDTITAPAGTQTVSQAALQARARFNTGTDTIDNAYAVDVNAWGGDRLYRGSNTSLRAVVINIDNLTLPTDRGADLRNMVPGDRIRFNNIPVGPLGITQWDGWLLDKDELHRAGTQACDLYSLYLAPCPAVPDLILGTDRWGAGGNASIVGSLTAGATSVSIAAADLITLMETVSVPYDIVIDAERMTITAVTGASSPQTATITRGVGGTIAATHSAGALLEIFQAKRIGL